MQGIQKNINNIEDDSPVKKRKDGEKAKKKKKERSGSKDRKASVIVQGDDEAKKEINEIEMVKPESKEVTDNSVSADVAEKEGSTCMKALRRMFKTQKQLDEEKKADQLKESAKQGQKGQLSKRQQKVRARENWAKLRGHVRNMRFKINIGTFLNEESEMTKKMMGYDADDKKIPNYKYDDLGNQIQKDQNKTFLQNIVINPETSNWFKLWNFTRYVTMFVGYFVNMWFFAFYYNVEVTDKSTTPEKSSDQIIDIIMMTDIILHFITAFQVDQQYDYRLLSIGFNYMQNGFIFDVAATLPGLITYQNQTYFWFKLIRFYHIRDVFNSLNIFNNYLFQMMNMNKSLIDKTSITVQIAAMIITAIHIFACIWIIIGREIDGSWLRGCVGVDGQKSCPELITFDNYKIFITSVYWVITTLTTVGYGDQKGYTKYEYLFQMAIEFLGIALFSFLMGSINTLVVTDQKLQDIIDERIEDLDIWLRRLDKSRTKILPKNLYDSIKDFVEKSFYFDYNLIRSQEFYEQLKPKIKHKLIFELFKSFKEHFEYMFDDDDFEAGNEFICDFISNLYSRIYLPGNEIIEYGDTFPELFMIQDGIVKLSLKGIGSENEFFILPTYTYFGDYQILYDLKSQIVYKSGHTNKHLIAMCLKKNKFKELLEDYPDARKFYMNRAWARRSEFRRRAKKHERKLKNLQNIGSKGANKSGKNKKEKKDKKQDSNSSNSSQENSSDKKKKDDKEKNDENASVDLSSHSSFNDQSGSGSESDYTSSNESNNSNDSDEQKRKRRQLKKEKFMSKFFVEVNTDEELDSENDIPIEELERISEDELLESREQILKERNKKKSQENAENIQHMMKQMGHAFERMNMSLGKNLISVNKHIENLKNGENIIEEEPELESLSLILNALTLKIQERVNNINSKKKMEKYLQTGLEKSMKQKAVSKEPEIKKKMIEPEKKENKNQNQYVDYESDESRK